MAISVKFESIAKKVYRRLLSIPVVGTTAKVLVARRRGQPQAWYRDPRTAIVGLQAEVSELKQRLEALEEPQVWYRDPRTGTLLQAIVGLQAEVSELKQRLEALEERQRVRS